ncbi:MAG: Lactoylglutathione lyase [Anaerolineales bacterium]|nr:Lactoylglutathione lyase [Anaerolineales bacterium]
MKLEHVALNVEDPAGMAEWYTQHLGMRVVFASDAPPHIRFLADEAGSMIELYHNAEAELPDYAGINRFNLHLAFAVDDIAASRDALVAAGATTEGEIVDLGVGEVLFLRDPWSVPIQLVKRAKPLV